MKEILTFCTFIAIFAIGDIVSVSTKAWLPSLFIISVLSIAGYWTGFLPNDFFANTGLTTTFVFIIYYFQLVNMGAIIGLAEMKRQWKTVLIATAGLIGLAIGVILIAGPLVGFDYAIAGAPPLSGGIIAYEIIRDASMRMNREDLAVIAISVYVLQSFVGFPLTSYLLKVEARRLKLNSNLINNSLNNEKISKKKKLIPKISDKYNTTNMIIFKLAFISVIGIAITTFINNRWPSHSGGDTISRYVILLILGVIFNELGFLDDSPVKKAEIGGFQNVIIIGFSVIAGLAIATPDIVLKIIGPVAVIIFAGVLGMLIFALVAGKLLGFSKAMSMCVALTALYGYPGTEILTREAIGVIAETKEENNILTDDMMPKMIVGGFVTVTFGSVFLASFMVQFL